MAAPATADERAHLAQLLVLTGRGDQAAFAALYQLASSRLFGVCLRLLRNRSEAEEVLQEVCITVWRRAATFDAGKAAAMTWLMTLARNKAIDRLRQHREATLDDPRQIEDAADEQPSPPSQAQSSQERQRLQRCLDALEPTHQAAVRAAFFTGATYNELAARTKVPLGTMKSWIRRSLLQLRTCLET